MQPGLQQAASIVQGMQMRQSADAVLLKPARRKLPAVTPARSRLRRSTDSSLPAVGKPAKQNLGLPKDDLQTNLRRSRVSCPAHSRCELIWRSRDL